MYEWTTVRKRRAAQRGLWRFWIGWHVVTACLCLALHLAVGCAVDRFSAVTLDYSQPAATVAPTTQPADALGIGQAPAEPFGAVPDAGGPSWGQVAVPAGVLLTTIMGIWLEKRRRARKRLA